MCTWNWEDGLPLNAARMTPTTANTAGSGANTACAIVFVVTALKFIFVSSHAFDLVSGPFIATHTSGCHAKTLIPTHWNCKWRMLCEEIDLP